MIPPLLLKHHLNSASFCFSDNKRVVISLTYIVWVGFTQSKNILNSVNISENTKVKDLSEKELDLIRSKISEIPTEVEIKRDQALNIKRLQEIWTYRWMRHRIWLPCRWQGTASNARTCKSRSGKKKVAIPGKKT